MKEREKDSEAMFEWKHTKDNLDDWEDLSKNMSKVLKTISEYKHDWQEEMKWFDELSKNKSKR